MGENVRNYKNNFIKEYWAQLIAIVGLLLLLGQLYSEFNTLKQELKNSQETQNKFWVVFNEKIDKTISILNDEDDGVRSDFNVGDEYLKEKILELEKYENLRAEKDKLELKVWFYERQKK